MKVIRFATTLTCIVLLVGMIACGSVNPISESIDPLTNETLAHGLNTDGILFDGVPNVPSDKPVVVPPGSNHLIVLEPSEDTLAESFKAECSAGSWVLDGKETLSGQVFGGRVFEWRAPFTSGPVQLLFTSVGSGAEFKLGITLMVSDEYYLYPKPSAPCERELTIVNPFSGETVVAAAGELLVKLRKSRPLADVMALRSAQDYQVLERISAKEPIFRVKFDDSLDLTSVWAQLAKDPRIEVVEPNYIAYPLLVPDDPHYSEKYEFPKIDAPEAWDMATGNENVWVAVIDTGVDRDHPDLMDNVMPGADFIVGGDGLGGETPGDGVDNNQDGIVDQNVGHGTHVAGIIASQAFNGKGACGVAFNAKVLPLRVFPVNGDTGATFSSIIQAVGYATEESRVKVINMSIGTTYYSTLLQEAINNAWEAGKVLVAAAANANTSQEYYPAAHDHVVAVAALNKTGQKASYSNYGEWVDISAYGSGIYSTYFDDKYAISSGTSMACPLVSGCIALLFAFDPSISNEKAVELITTYTDDVYELNPSYEGQLGSGIVNPYLALDALWHSQPGSVDDAASDGDYSNGAFVLGPHANEG